jgi:hypothetical protein
MTHEMIKQQLIEYSSPNIYKKWVLDKKTGFRVSERQFAEWVLDNMFYDQQFDSEFVPTKHMFMKMYNDPNYLIDDSDFTKLLFEIKVSEIKGKFQRALNDEEKI